MIDASDHANLKNTVQVLQQEVERLLEKERALSALQSQNQCLLDDLAEGYFEATLAGEVTRVNRSLGELMGYLPAELIGRNIREFTSVRIAGITKKIFTRIYRTGQQAKITDVAVTCKDGTTKLVELSAALINDIQTAPAGFRGLLRELSDPNHKTTRQRHLEAQRQQVQKMEAIETLAGSLALDFNNLLMSIQGNTSLMEMKIDAGSPLSKNLERINESVAQGIHLTKQLLSFAKVGKFVVMPTDLNPIIHRSTRMFARNRSHITFKRYLKKGLWQTDVDRVQLSQAILTLFMRAADDMPNGGDICIETDNVILDDDYLIPYGLEPGRYVRTSISDSGQGMDETTQRRIFEPFFSANGDAAPTDLGLAAVHGILKSHSGLINVYSEPGHGTAFNLYLPISKKESAQWAEISGDPSEQQITLLLIDDDEAILKAGAHLLRRLGYRVLTASNGSAAVELFGQQKNAIRLIIMDMIMPDVSPDALLGRLKAVDATVTVLLCSGFSRNRQIDQLLEKDFDGFLQKPFNRQDLARQLDDILASPPA